jgi:hypothetical protein
VAEGAPVIDAIRYLLHSRESVGGGVQVGGVAELVGRADVAGGAGAAADAVTVGPAALRHRQAAVLGHPVHQLGHGGAEAVAQLGQRDRRVLDDVVQQRRGDHLLAVATRCE